MVAIARESTQAFYGPNNDDVLSPVKTRSNLVSTRAVQEIRQALFSGNLKAGNFLGSESDLIKHFGISRVPMRDALRSLEAMGIIEIRVGGKGGIFVAQGNPVKFAEALAIQHKLLGISFDEMVDMHIAIEEMAVELVILNASEDELDNISDFVKQLARYEDDQHEFMHKAPEMHNAIASATGNRAIMSQMHVFNEILFKYFMPRTHVTEQAKNVNFAAMVLKNDRKLIKLMRERNVDAARHQIRKHWNRVRKLII